MSSSPLVSSPKVAAPRKSVKAASKDKAEKVPKPTKSGAPHPKVSAKRKLAAALVAALPTPIPGARLVTKLQAPGPVQKEEKGGIPFIQHKAKEIPVQFIAALNSKDENGKLDIEVDDDTAAYLTDLANKFSMDVDFKIPVRKGKKKNHGKYFVSGKIEEDERDGHDLVPEETVDRLMRNLVEIRGNLKTYHFNANKGDGNYETLKGCGLKINYLALPAQSPQPAEEAEEEEEEDAE